MKVICNRGALVEALNVTAGLIAPRTPKPVLQCVKISAAGNELSISATDLEVAVLYRDNQVEVESPGEALVQADKLREIVRESIDDTLSLQLVGDTVEVRGQDSLFKMPTQPVETFPPVPGFEGEVDFEVPGGLLKHLIGQTLFAAAKTSTRYAFNGVLLVAKAKTITLVATDGHRLALAKGELAKAAKGEKDGLRAIIPAKAMALVERLVDNPEEAVGMQVRPNQVIVHTPRATLTTNLVEGQFPPYEDVIPKDADRRMTASTGGFLSAVRRASLLATEESKGLRLSFSKNGLVLSTHSPVAGDSTVNFPCKFDGQDLEIGFSPLYLVDALRAANVDEVTFDLLAANRPGLIRGGNFLYVIMPVNLQS